jgi:DNA-directed RNA polymerase specialized sigma24 family protein
MRTAGARPDEREFVEFFYEVEVPLRRFAERVAPPGLDPEDLAAEGLARACARWPRLQRLPYRRAWLFRVTANVALDGRRRPRTVLCQKELRRTLGPTFEERAR